jgi:hypothetical protein
MPTQPSVEARYAYWFLTDWEFDFSLIGISEYIEREEVFAWLVDDEAINAADPRGEAQAEEQERRIEPRNESDQGEIGKTPPEAENPLLEFIPTGLSNRWCFTKDDPDFYPSVPHGHLNQKTNAWPKLNPYTGRAFSTKDIEATAYRLQKREMIQLWNDSKFRQHALETIVWYEATFPYYKFPVRNPCRLPHWRRR